MRTNYRSLNIFILFILFIFSGCSSISLYDHYSYLQVVSIKVDALALMERAVEDADLYNDQIERLQLEIEKIYEYEKGRPKNEISASMWRILKDPERNLLGGFISRWKAEKQLNPVFIAEAKKLISKSFDLIAELESGKIKPEDVSGSLITIFNINTGR